MDTSRQPNRLAKLDFLADCVEAGLLSRHEVLQLAQPSTSDFCKVEDVESKNMIAKVQTH